MHEELKIIGECFSYYTYVNVLNISRTRDYNIDTSTYFVHLPAYPVALAHGQIICYGDLVMCESSKERRIR